MVSRNLTLLVAAAALVAATGAVATPAPASAATCSTTRGVSVVVDFHELGGGVRTACIADGAGRLASDLFPAAGYSLDYVQREPGFVCRVSGVPASDPCVNTPPADAYWGLWWSDGKTGTWSYASSGAASLRVPEGGYVAFSWNGTSARSAPGASPAPHPTAAPTPIPAPSSAPPSTPATGAAHTRGPSNAPVAPSHAPTSASPNKPAEQQSEGPRPHQHHPSATVQNDMGTTSPSASAEATTAPTSVASDPADPDDGGLPAWVAPAVIAVLFGAVGAVLVVRRRRASP